MAFHGICSYPHGGRISAALLFTMAAASVCTCVSMASCRFARLQFSSDQGNFDTHFTNNAGTATEATYQVGIGLFNWLRPYSYKASDDDQFIDTSGMDWKQGACVGYTTLQVNAFDNTQTQSVRILGVFSVLAALSTFGFSWFVACMALRNFQRYLLAFCCFAVAVLNGCTLLLPQSGMCTSIGTNTSCRLDQGALVAIGAVIFWVASGLLTSFYMEVVDIEGFHDRQLNQRKATLKKKKQRQQQQQEKRQKRRPTVETNIDWTSNHRRSTSRGRNNNQPSTTPTTVSSSRSTPRNTTTTLVMPDQSLEVLPGYNKPPRRSNSTGSNYKHKTRTTSRTIPRGDDTSPRYSSKEREQQRRHQRAAQLRASNTLLSASNNGGQRGPVDLDETPEPSSAANSSDENNNGNVSGADKYVVGGDDYYVREVPRSASLDMESERWTRARAQQQPPNSISARKTAIENDLEKQDKQSSAYWPCQVCLP